MPSSSSPKDYIELAHELADGTTNEVRLRAAVGRAYYGIFLQVKTKAHIQGKERVHPRAKAAVGDKNFAAIGAYGELLLMRKHADYYLKPGDEDYDRSFDDWQNNWSRAQVCVRDLLAVLDAW